MNKIIILATIVVIAITIYVLTRPNAEKPIVDLPNIAGPEPSKAPQQQQIDPSKVKTEDIELGTGDEAVPGKKVSVQYRGTLTDGTEFDSSYSRNSEPLVFTVDAGQMILGFDFGVRGMKVGGTRKITIPPELGYGNQAVGDKIPANSVLIFEVKLEKVE